MKSHQQYVIYECDQCLNVEQALSPGPASAPTGWVTVEPSLTSNGDWFCSWECLSEWCKVRAVERDKKLAEFKARSRAAKEKQAATKASG